jgi:hypothetical protein
MSNYRMSDDAPLYALAICAIIGATAGCAIIYVLEWMLR